MCSENDFRLAKVHPRRPRGSHSGREKRRDESFQAQAEEPLNTDSHQIISKRSSECWLLIGRKKMLCIIVQGPFGEQPCDCPWVPDDGQSTASKGLYVKNEADI